ncbi:hypothetical protein Drorol1_Dr00015293, partial [Drosera rotundifolia]
MAATESFTDKNVVFWKLKSESENKVRIRSDLNRLLILKEIDSLALRIRFSTCFPMHDSDGRGLWDLDLGYFCHEPVLAGVLPRQRFPIVPGFVLSNQNSSWLVVKLVYGSRMIKVELVSWVFVELVFGLSSWSH